MRLKASSAIQSPACLLAVVAASCSLSARALDHVTLTNGFEVVCDHRETIGERVRLYTSAGNESFMELPQADILTIESMPAPPITAATSSPAADISGLMAASGRRYRVDVDLLASVIKAESGGNTHAVSRAGARGLMQLMPQTASELGVTDSFAPEENINGGTAYLNALLDRYNDNLQLALAAYNAGPVAVDHYHGVPPYRETRAYVARVIREFNRRVAARQSAARSAASR